MNEISFFFSVEKEIEFERNLLCVRHQGRMSKKVDLNDGKTGCCRINFQHQPEKKLRVTHSAAAALDTQHRFTKGHEFAGNIETRVDRHQQSTEMKVSSIL